MGIIRFCVDRYNASKTERQDFSFVVFFFAPCCNKKDQTSKLFFKDFIINWSYNTQAYPNWSQMHKHRVVKHFQEFLVSVLRKLSFRHSLFFQFDTNRKRSKTDILFRNVCLFLPVFLLRYVLDLDKK